MRRAEPAQRPPRSAGVPLAAFGLLLCLAAPATAAQAADPAFEHGARLWDEGKHLSPPARAALERQLAAAERKSGVPIFVLVTDRVHGNSVAEVAATAFAAQGLGREPARNPVLLTVALQSGNAAVETGKGSAGIVPEVDARRIEKQLARQLPSRHPESAIGQAIAAVAMSAQATAARRTPLPRDPLAGMADDDQPPLPIDDDAGTSGGEPASDAGSSAKEARPTRDGGLAPGVPAGGPPEGGRRSLMPVAIGVAVVVMLGLALRRRKQITSGRAPTDSERPRRF